MRTVFQLCGVLLFLRIASCRLICSRRHFTVDGAFFQRVELPTAQLCVERCIEYIEYCRSAVFKEIEEKPNGICQLHPINSADSSEALHPEANLEPVSTVYELLEVCSSFSKSDMTDEISEQMRQRLNEPKKAVRALSIDDEVIIRKADAFLPERDNFGSGQDTVVYNKEDKGYAMMKSVDESLNPSRNPFDTPPPMPTTNNRGKVRPSFHSEESNDIAVPSYGPSPTGNLIPIQPVQVLHHGVPLHPQDSTSHRGTYDSSCQIGGFCVPSLQQLDRSPCPARQGDPCAPKPRCGYQTEPSQPCPQVDAPIESSWSEWGGCSVTCGIGSKTRQCSGANCAGFATSPCALEPCQEWTPWTMWTPCSASCGIADRTRKRECRGGRDCPGLNMESERCNLAVCAEWSEWGSWETCSVSCGTGREKRYRQCEGGLTCIGVPVEERLCNNGPCPNWTPWTQWSHCSATCGGGETSRTRECMNGPGCVGGDKEKRECNMQTCPIWMEWTQWTLCQQKCGEEAVRLRNRVCIYKGVPYAGCDGAAQDQSPCPLTQCPVWSEWSDWTECSQTCGQGTQIRTRSCEGHGCDGSPREMRFCQIAVCPYWAEWSDWGGCSVSCGMGICERRRKCIIDDIVNLPNLEELEAAAADDDDKGGPSVRMTSDMARAAIIAKHRQMLSKRSLNGTMRSLRQTNGILDNVKCDGSEFDRKQCDAGPCCGWDNWSDWSECVGCGSSAVSKRSRTCPSGSSASFTPPLLFQVDPQTPFIPSTDRYASNSISLLNNPSSYQQQSMMLNGLSPIVPVNHRGKRHSHYSVNRGPSCVCEGSSSESRSCSEGTNCESEANFSHDQCEWTQWGQWCGCVKCRAGREVRRRFCDLPSRSPGGPTRPDPNCHCDGTDIEERTCRVDETCLGGSGRSSVDSERPSYPRGHSSNTGAFNKDRDPDNEKSSTETDINTQGTGFGEEDGYVGPIVSSVHVSNANGRTYHTKKDGFSQKDSIISTTQDSLTGELCRWSKWSGWSTCQATRLKQRNRFCIGSDSLVSNCQCMGLSTEETSCTPNEKIASSVEFIAISSGKAGNDDDADNDGLRPAIERMSAEEDNEDESSRTKKKCEWARWSQWSSCTATCGDAERLRRRRCPCGEEEDCGGGITTETEPCDLLPCDKAKQLPKFSIVA